MSFPQEFLDEINELEHSDVYTPELFAWKLLLNEKSVSLSSQLQTFTDTYDTEDDPVTFFFEIAITIFLELVFGTLKLNHYSDENNVDVPFKATFDNSTIEDMYPIIQQKFIELNLVLHVLSTDEESEPEHYKNNLKTKRYCRIIFKHNQTDHATFVMNADNIDEDKDYHMMLNGKCEKTNQLKDLFATWYIAGKTHKISFDKFVPVPTPLKFDEY